MKLIGISGVTNSGKTTLARALLRALAEDGREGRILSQDAFFRPDDQVLPSLNWVRKVRCLV